MAVLDFSTANSIIQINGRVINDWGNAEQPYTDAPINPKAQLNRGLGGNATITRRLNPGRTVTISLNPGSPDATFMHGLMNSGAIISMTRTQLGTLETSVATEGVIVNDGENGRSGMTPSDGVYIMEFNVWGDTK